MRVALYWYLPHDDNEWQIKMCKSSIWKVVCHLLFCMCANTEHWAMTYWKSVASVVNDFVYIIISHTYGKTCNSSIIIIHPANVISMGKEKKKERNKTLVLLHLMFSGMRDCWIFTAPPHFNPKQYANPVSGYSLWSSSLMMNKQQY